MNSCGGIASDRQISNFHLHSAPEYRISSIGIRVGRCRGKHGCPRTVQGDASGPMLHFCGAEPNCGRRTTNPTTTSTPASDDRAADFHRSPGNAAHSLSGELRQLLTREFRWSARSCSRRKTGHNHKNDPRSHHPRQCCAHIFFCHSERHAVPFRGSARNLPANDTCQQIPRRASE